MNALLNKLLLEGDKFMSEKHLKQPEFTYSSCSPFTKNKVTIKEFKETGNSTYIYQDELGKACVQLDTAYGEFKDLNRRTAADKVLNDKAFNIAKNPKYDGYQRGITSMVYKCFHKKVQMEQLKMKIVLINNQQKNHTNHLLENLIKEQYNQVLQTLFGIQIQKICN